MSATPMKGETAGTEIGYAKPRQEAGAMIRNSETLGCSVSARLKVQWELEREKEYSMYMITEGRPLKYAGAPQMLFSVVKNSAAMKNHTAAVVKNQRLRWYSAEQI